MRTGMYALLAVILGVMLVGFLPGEISNLSVSHLETTRTKVNDNGFIPPTNSSTSNINLANSSTLKQSSTTIGGIKNQTQGSKLAVPSTPHDQYADVEYYGLWSVGFLIALAVYFLAKRMLS